MQHWQMYLFEYLIGGAFFVLGMIIAVRSGDMEFQKRESKKYFVVLVVGLAMYALFHGLWNYAAIYL